MIDKPLLDAENLTPPSPPLSGVELPTLNPPPPPPTLSGGSPWGKGFAPSPDKGRAGEGFGLAGEGLTESGLVEERFLPYSSNLTALARENRKNPTPAEKKIWNEVLRMRQFSEYKFLRQKPLGGYIVDFYCSELHLVIEIDGDSHAENIEYDEARTRFLQSLGLTVVRYANSDVMNNISGVYDDLRQRIDKLAPNPNPNPNPNFFWVFILYVNPL